MRNEKGKSHCKESSTETESREHNLNASIRTLSFSERNLFHSICHVTPHTSLHFPFPVIIPSSLTALSLRLGFATCHGPNQNIHFAFSGRSLCEPICDNLFIFCPLRPSVAAFPSASFCSSSVAAHGCLFLGMTNYCYNYDDERSNYNHYYYCYYYYDCHYDYDHHCSNNCNINSNTNHR